MGPDLFRPVFEGVDVNHPAEKLRHPASTGRIALRFCLNGAIRAEVRPVRILERAFRRQADIYMGMPLSHTQWNPPVEIRFLRPFGSGVHGTFQFRPVIRLFIEERSGLFGVEAKG